MHRCLWGRLASLCHKPSLSASELPGQLGPLPAGKPQLLVWGPEPRPPGFTSAPTRAGWLPSSVPGTPDP